MLNKKMIAVAVALAALTSGAASAQNTVSQGYVGGTFGKAKWNDECAPGATCSTNPTSYKVFVGYNINDTFAIEGAYFDLGKIKANASVAGKPVTAEVKGSGFEVSGVATFLRKDGLDLFGKLGVSRVTGKSESSIPNFYKVKVDSNSTQPVFGLGLNYHVTKDVAIRAEWENRKVKLANAKDAVNSYNVGVQFHF